MALLKVMTEEITEAQEYEITDERVTIGRTDENTVVLQDESASRKHAAITQTAGGFVLEDAGSSNGTWVNRKRVDKHLLADGDEIRIGGATFIFSNPPTEVKTVLMDMSEYVAEAAAATGAAAEVEDDAVPEVTAPMPVQSPASAAPAPSAPEVPASAPVAPPPPREQPPEPQAPPPQAEARPAPPPPEAPSPPAQTPPPERPQPPPPREAPPPRPQAPPPSPQASPPPAQAPPVQPQASPPPPQVPPPRPQAPPPQPQAPPPRPAPVAAAASTSARRSLSSPGAAPTEGEVAGFWIRAAAYLIDGAILGVAMAVIMVPVGIISAMLAERAPGVVVVLNLLVSLLCIAASIGYIVYPWATRGWTLGKKFLSLRVVREDGVEPMGYKTALLRLVGYMASGFIMYIGFIMVAFTDGHKGLHDMIAKTRVIKVPKE